MPIKTASGDSRVWWPNRSGSTIWPTKGSPMTKTAAVSTSFHQPGSIIAASAIGKAADTKAPT